MVLWRFFYCNLKKDGVYPFLTFVFVAYHNHNRINPDKLEILSQPCDVEKIFRFYVSKDVTEGSALIEKSIDPDEPTPSSDNLKPLISPSNQLTETTAYQSSSSRILPHTNSPGITNSQSNSQPLNSLDLLASGQAEAAGTVPLNNHITDATSSSLLGIDPPSPLPKVSNMAPTPASTVVPNPQSSADGNTVMKSIKCAAPPIMIVKLNMRLS